MVSLTLLVACCASPGAETNKAAALLTPTDFAAYAKRKFWDANIRFHRRNHDPQEAWRFGRACFDLADFATNNTERAEIAEEGIAACRILIESEPGSAPAHYYLGMNLGQLAQTKGLAALKLVDDMEHEFLIVRGLDENFDYAGADRNLGLLYSDAPSFGSIGSRTKARQHLQKATQVAPDYPENRLNLIEAYLKWNDRNGARRELKSLEEILPKARTNLVGDDWASSWFAWDKRFQKVKKRIEEPSKALESPREKN
jgi:tetratricopeptide (TPR) repeat protein